MNKVLEHATDIERVTTFVQNVRKSQDEQFDEWYESIESNLYRKPIEAKLEGYFKRQLRTLAFLAWLDGNLNGFTSAGNQALGVIGRNSEQFLANPHREELVK